MLLKTILCLLLLTDAISSEGISNCSSNLQWSTENGRIIVNGHPLVIKGVNYFGFERKEFAPDGLNIRNLSEYLNDIKNNGFNAIRVPFSMELVRRNPKVSISCANNSDLCGRTAFHVLDTFISRAANRGLLIVLSNHRLAAGGYISPARWYDSSYSEEDVISYWRSLVIRYKHQWNVFAIDLKNDPHDEVTWGNSNRDTDWNKAAERMINRLKDFRGLFFVQGINWSNKFGRVFLIDTGNAALNNRVVYSPHSYGPSNNPQHTDVEYKNIPNTQDDIYMGRYGFLLTELNRTVVIGEWGGTAEAGTDDEKWHVQYVKWLRKNCMTNNFYWALNPNPHHIGGLLDDDWTSPMDHKLNMLDCLQPNPTKFTTRHGQICIEHGTFPEAKCQPRGVPAVSEKKCQIYKAS